MNSASKAAFSSGQQQCTANTFSQASLLLFSASPSSSVPGDLVIHYQQVAAAFMMAPSRGTFLRAYLLK